MNGLPHNRRDAASTGCGTDQDAAAWSSGRDNIRVNRPTRPIRTPMTAGPEAAQP